MSRRSSYGTDLTREIKLRRSKTVSTLALFSVVAISDEGATAYRGCKAARARDLAAELEAGFVIAAEMEIVCR